MLLELCFSGLFELSCWVPGKRERRKINYNNFADVTAHETILIAQKLMGIM